MVPHMVMYISFLFSLRASCCGGSPHPRTAKTERSSTTRSNTGKGHGGVKTATPPPAPSFSSSSAVRRATDSAVSSQLITRALKKPRRVCDTVFEHVGLPTRSTPTSMRSSASGSSRNTTEIHTFYYANLKSFAPPPHPHCSTPWQRVQALGLHHTCAQGGLFQTVRFSAQWLIHYNVAYGYRK